MAPGKAREEEVQAGEAIGADEDAATGEEVGREAVSELRGARAVTDSVVVSDPSGASISRDQRPRNASRAASAAAHCRSSGAAQTRVNSARAAAISAPLPGYCPMEWDRK